MGATSKIEWTDATVNFWWGCTKVGPGCDHCYAERFDKRVGGAHWGHGAPRREIKSADALIYRLDSIAALFRAEHGRRRRLFVQSMSDLFDLEVPAPWFARAWNAVSDCDALAIQIVTKRLPAIDKRLTEAHGCLGDRAPWPQHAGLIATVCNQDEAQRDIPRLRDLKRRLGIPWVGLSVEPMLGPIRHDLAGIDWVICGGESGGKDKVRTMHPDWAEWLMLNCRSQGVAFFMKQMTGKAPIPDRLMLRQFPEALR